LNVEDVKGAPLLGVDVGGTRIKAGLVDRSGRVLVQRVHWLDGADRTEDGVIARIIELVDLLDPEQRTRQVGVGVPGAVRWPDGVVTSSPNFPEWSNFALRERLIERLDRSVCVDNDANCVVTGAYHLDGYGEVPSVVGFTLGTGVGGALILNGRLYRGRQGMAGEVGHITVEPEGPTCGCGSRGCLEMYASRMGLRRMCLETPLPGVDPEDPRLPERLSERSRSGDVAARRCFERAGTALGQAIAVLANTLDMELVLIAGGMAPEFDLMESTMWSEIRARTYSAVHENLRVVAAQSRDAAGVAGTALTALTEGRG
jgi:glucokinase